MIAAVNYYELKTQLAELGYDQPEIAMQLAAVMADPHLDNTIRTNVHGVHFSIDLQAAPNGDQQLHLCLGRITDEGAHRYQLFAAGEVPAGEAAQLLRYRPRQTDHIDQVSAIPLTLEQVRLINSVCATGADIPLQLITNPDARVHKSLNTMNTENLSYLQKQLLNLGFGEQMNEALEKQIQAKLPEFTLDASNTYNKQDVGYTLHFKAGDQNEMYFFNKYEAKLDDKQQTFYINQGSGITAKEAYNLMDGRAVYKELENREGEKYKAWIILDKDNKAENGDLKLKTYSEGWNYKPERAIDKMDIVGINDEGARDKLMRSLEKGNRHQVEAVRDGKPVKVFLEANPAEHLVNITNYKGEPQKLDHYKKAEVKPAAKQTETQQQDASKKKTRGKKVSV